jgi:hypothetical protein
MKKWQKITGLIVLSLIAIYELLTWANTYVYLKYVVEPTDNDLLIEQSYIYIDALSFGMWMNLALAVFLFIYLWRKSMTQTCSSPIKTISDEKITIPFTFERAYCRIGVATDNSGIERMEVYFVRNDKTAICYRNCSFNQVIIDDAKLDKYDSLEINRGDIISIRATTGLANYIIKLSDERLIVFEVLPKGYGGLYENITIIVPSANEYSDYLEDYKQGIEFDS